MEIKVAKNDDDEPYGVNQSTGGQYASDCSTLNNQMSDHACHNKPLASKVNPAPQDPLKQAAEQPVAHFIQHVGTFVQSMQELATLQKKVVTERAKPPESSDSDDGDDGDDNVQSERISLSERTLQQKIRNLTQQQSEQASHVQSSNAGSPFAVMMHNIQQSLEKASQPAGQVTLIQSTQQQPNMPKLLPAQMKKLQMHQQTLATLACAFSAEPLSACKDGVDHILNTVENVIAAQSKNKQWYQSLRTTMFFNHQEPPLRSMQLNYGDDGQVTGVTSDKQALFFTSNGDIHTIKDDTRSAEDILTLALDVLQAAHASHVQPLPHAMIIDKDILAKLPTDRLIHQRIQAMKSSGLLMDDVPQAAPVPANALQQRPQQQDQSSLRQQLPQQQAQLSSQQPGQSSSLTSADSRRNSM
jgi:hypothetical protein